MDLVTFRELNRKVVEAGFEKEIYWQEHVSECADASEFAWNAVWVIISSGMNNQIARTIESRIVDAWNDCKPLDTAFKHKGKVKAIKYILDNSEKLFEHYLEADDKLSYLETLPFIGTITKYHLAKNLGEDVVKPDRHLIRIAKNEGKTPDQLCSELASQMGCKKATVDIIIWRAANLGFI
jgi:hypothetical protein